MYEVTDQIYKGGPNPKETIVISFSGGATSATLTYLLLLHFSQYYNFVVVFANTGKEDEKTLQFINNCDNYLGFNTVWLEAITNPTHGIGVRAKVVTFETAARNGEPFEEMIKKHGISNRNAPTCTRELKTRTVLAYLRTKGLRKCRTAIGIRSDEADRINPDFKKNRIIYPFIRSKGWPNFGNFTKAGVNIYWQFIPFRLGILEEDGNCDACFKKNLFKLFSIARRRPKVFDWWDGIETKYNTFVPESRLKLGQGRKVFNFYRHNLSAKDILKLSKLPDDEIKKILKVDDLRAAVDDCGESCEAF